MPTGTSPRRPRQEILAAEAWRLFLDYFLGNSDRFNRIATSAGLTVSHAKALITLDADCPKPMRALAEEWRCDASNVTWLVDRLEALDLVARTPSPSDRRVKTVVLTPAGVRTRARLLDQIYQPPDEFSALGRARLEALTDAVQALAAARSAGGVRRPSTRLKASS
jgi:DNA-binding MarR family transcriptional regulator